MKKLEKGDIFLLEVGDMVYADIPERFVIHNRPYSWKMRQHKTKIGETYHNGKYLVVDGKMDGGGTGHGAHDVYPDGYKISAVKIADEDVIGSCKANDIIESEKVSFYQTGLFTAMITRDIEVVGKATMDWKIT